MATNKMCIAVLSGKGGTGKTLVSVNLASVAKKATYIDCDVEEPNGHLFFKAKQVTNETVSIRIPVVNEQLCNGCRICVDFCKFNALAMINGNIKVFETVCHSCGGCTLLCPKKAIFEKEKVIGNIEKGISDNVNVHTGILNTGEATGIPIIKALLSDEVINSKNLTIIDCPPGSACIVMESIREADYCILVAEPTIFGVHNLEMVYELVRLFEKPHGVVLNKCLEENNPAEKFCLENEIDIIGRISFDFELGMLNSEAKIAVKHDKKYHKIFTSILQNATKEGLYETTAHT